MIDFGFDKIALISAVALIVIGPEKLPRVARTVGTLLGAIAGGALGSSVQRNQQEVRCR